MEGDGVCIGECSAVEAVSWCPSVLYNSERQAALLSSTHTFHAKLTLAFIRKQHGKKSAMNV